MHPPIASLVRPQPQRLRYSSLRCESNILDYTKFFNRFMNLQYCLGPCRTSITPLWASRMASELEKQDDGPVRHIFYLFELRPHAYISQEIVLSPAGRLSLLFHPSG